MEEALQRYLSPDDKSLPPHGLTPEEIQEYVDMSGLSEEAVHAIWRIMQAFVHLGFNHGLGQPVTDAGQPDRDDNRPVSAGKRRRK